MKHPVWIFVLGIVLAVAVNLSGLTPPSGDGPPISLMTRREPVDRSAVNNVSRGTETTPEAEETPTELPSCNPGEHYDPVMDRCWPDGVDEPTPIPSDVQDMMDSNPYDNDYQYIGICWDYVDGGTRIVYFPCDATPEP